MWIISIRDLSERGDGKKESHSRRLFSDSKEEALLAVKDFVDFAKENHYLIETNGETGQNLHIWNPNNPMDDCMLNLYETDINLEEITGITFKSYHYRDEYDLECIRNTKTGIVSVYLDNHKCPTYKCCLGVMPLKEYADDLSAIAAVLPNAEDIIEGFEEIGNEDTGKDG